MSIGSIGAYSNWWQSQNQATAGSSAATATSSSSSIPNTGSLAATSNMSTFMQSFSADLQSMLTQLGNETGSSATSSATTSATSASSGSGNVDQTGTVQAQGASITIITITPVERARVARRRMRQTNWWVRSGNHCKAAH